MPTQAMILSRYSTKALIDSSNWSPTQAITVTSKSALVQELVYEGVIERRQTQVLDIRKGWQMFRLVSLIRKHPEELRSLLVHNEQTSCLNVNDMLNLFHFGVPKDEREQTTTVWCMAETLDRSSEEPGKLLSEYVRHNTVMVNKAFWSRFTVHILRISLLLVLL